MALIKCEECGHDVSSKAEACPNCGAKPRPPPKTHGVRNVFLIFVLFLIGFPFLDLPSSTSVSTSPASESDDFARIRALRLITFKQNPDKVIAELRGSFEKGEFKKVALRAKIYLASQNEEVVKLHDDAVKAQAVIDAAKVERRKQEKVESILAQLKSVPASELALNKNLYHQLTLLKPNSGQYQAKLTEYSGKLAEQQERERVAREAAQKEDRIAHEARQQEQDRRTAKFGEAPIQSAWDGSYRAVERYLERAANDPESIKIDNCTKVYFTEEGWLVGCDYLGKNASPPSEGSIEKAFNEFCRSTSFGPHQPPVYDLSAVYEPNNTIFEPGQSQAILGLLATIMSVRCNTAPPN